MRLQQRMVEMEREKAELADRLQVTETQASQVKRLEAERAVQELVLQKALVESERQRVKAEEAVRTAKENEELRQALESMRTNNELLAQRMQSAVEESKTQLDMERQEREEVERRMEAEKSQLMQQLVATQVETERLLSMERDKFNKRLASMEQDKNALSERVRATEEKSKVDSDILNSRLEEYTKGLHDMEVEKSSLENLVKENEEKSKKATRVVAETLAKERETLRVRMQQMEEDKMALKNSVAATEAQAQEYANTITKQLEEDKKALEENLNQMQKEKLQLAQHLASIEAQAQLQTTAVAIQLSKEKVDINNHLHHVEKEEEELKLKLHENDQLTHVGASQSVSVKLSQERESLQQRMVEMEREKAELAERLVVTENQSKERERMVSQRLERERDELMQTVERMKAELLQEKKAMEEAMAMKNNTTGHNSSGISLKPKRSLYDMMTDNDDRSVKSKELGSFLSRSIGTIQEISKDTRGGDNGDGDDNDDEENDVEVEVEDEGEDEEEGLDLDLPAPHAAGAKGDLNGLKELKRLNPTLLTSFDESHRTPLFYAVAYDKFEAAEYLINENAEMACIPDLNGDWPLHAATSAGSAQCVELLLKTMGTNLNCKNSMDMTPAHLVRNRACLELLYSYGCDITTTDANGRSPLFVACAMNRADVAEYLIEFLDSDESSLYVGDTRGDTPLHAAACNGSADCVLVLLQHAIDPRMENTKGLKPIDLAIRNKQHKCRELLAEYHLHFCTNSQFDSMLFLATLQGHKQVTHMLAASQPYEIIKKLGSSAREEFQTPERVRTMFSLTDDRSLRLETYGSWIAYNDQTSGSTYYYNHHTCSGQWEVPDKVKRLQHIPSSGSVDITTRLSNAKTSMRMRKIGEWIEYRTEMDQIFYYNDKNGDFQWVNPNASTDTTSTSYETPAADIWTAAAATSTMGTEGDNSSEIANDLNDWRAYQDPESGSMFWYNHKTNISQWECPHLETESSHSIKDNSNNSNSNYSSRNDRLRKRGNSNDYSEEIDVVNVYNDSDLGI
eukprot:gene5388-10775_t